MKKSVKKGLIIFGAVVGVILVLMILIPVLFKDKIKDKVIDVVNKQVDAKVEIEDFGLNLFTNFPNATLSLKNTSVAGIGDFEKDTLLRAQLASVTIDLSSLFGDNYKISGIDLQDAYVHAKMLADGRANWDIMKADSTATTSQSEESSSPFNLNLKKISISNCNIIFENDSTKMKVAIGGWNGTISGDFSASETTISTKSVIDQLSFTMDGIPYLSKVKTVAEASVSADLDKMKFVFDKSKLQINELVASIEGSFGMVGEDGMEFDLKLNAPDTQFKDILSMLPAMYTSDFKDIKTAGTAKIDAYVKGKMEGETYPAFDVKITVADAMFQYPSLPKAVNNINVDLAVNSKGGSLDNTVVDISKFSFDLGGSPFNGALNITTPMSDPNLKLRAKGQLNLGMIKEVYPLEKGTDLNGIINADINLATRLSAIEQERYEDVAATGHLNIDKMVYKSKEMPDVNINNAKLEFTPRYVNLTSMDVTIGKNDISASGRLENFIAYAMKDKTLKGQLDIKSNYLNANDFMGGETAATGNAEATSSETIIIPKNIDFALNVAMKQILYDKINITNMNGAVSVGNGVMSMNNVSANALGGACKVSGKYDTSNPAAPKVDFNLNLSNVSFAETFKSVETIQKFAPIFENLIGTYSMNLSMNTNLGTSILQTLGALSANGGIQTSNVKVENIPALTALSSALKTDALKSFSTKDINLPFTISDGRLTTKPFNINIGNGGVMKLEGSTGLDQTINYKGAITLPKSMSNNFVNNVPITIGGTFNNPKIGIDTKGLVENVVSNIAGDLLGGSIDSKKEELGAKLAEEKAKQAEKLRSEATKAADKIKAIAEQTADELVKKAGDNAIAKIAANAAADKLKKEANTQSKKLLDQAEEQIKKLDQE